MLRLAFALITTLSLAAGAALADEWKPLLTPAELASIVESQEPILVDIRGVADYREGHVEGAVNVPYHAWRGPESNPGALISDEKLTLILSELGVETGTPVVVTYRGANSTDFGSAARVYWTLKSAGVEEIAILNGGVTAWVEAGLDLSKSEASNFPSDAEFTFSNEWLIDRDGVRAVVEGHRAALLIDARPLTFFEGGKKHPLAAWAGTLTNALNLDHQSWFTNGASLIADPVELQAIAAKASHVPGGPEIVSFCNTGHWAATNWFVLSEIAGIEGVKLYPESMVGWSQAVGRVAQAD
ncbi:MAG TPA: rhodanese-like domain-containing protein [Thermohalobaculum sp.]|nr:rhodanese-like domain-containing protein [Thermohalobaculum sp.]